MKIKCRKVSLFWKFLAIVSVVCLLACATVGINSTLRRKSETIESAADITEEVAHIGCNILDTSDIKLGKQGDEYAAARVRSMLVTLRENSLAKYVYVLYSDGENWVYLADGSEDPANYRDVYDADYDTLNSVITGNNYVSDGFEEYEDEVLMSAYYAITDEYGEGIAVLGIDTDVSGYQARIHKAWRWITYITASVMLFSNIVAALATRTITRAVRLLYKKVDDINKSDGDLTSKVDIKTGDELELLADNFNVLLEFVRSVLQSIKHDTISLATSTQNLDILINNQSDAIRNTAATMEEMSAATEEIAASLQSVSENITTARESSDKLDSKAELNKEYATNIIERVRDTALRMEEMQKHVNSRVEAITSGVYSKLEESKKVYQINQMTSTILEIANKTNLLSLNASIEAAHAGDAGRGFAVVASEIQALATSSTRAAKDIQMVTEEVINAVESLVSVSNELLEFVGKLSDESFGSITDLSTKYTEDAQSFYDTFDNILASTKEMKESMKSITDAVQAVGVAVDENAKGIAGVAETATELSNDVGEITDIATSNKNVVESINKGMDKFIVE